jgi:hypothetical protein
MAGLKKWSRRRRDAVLINILGGLMKATQYQYKGRDLDYSGSQENWDYISESLELHREQAKQELERAKKKHAEAVEREELVVSLMKGAKRNEHLFYKLHLLLTSVDGEEDANRRAVNISFLRNPPSTMHGVIHRSIKIDGENLNTRKASYLFEDVENYLLYRESVISVSICYLQGYTFFKLNFFYDVLGKCIAKKYRKPEIRVVEQDRAIRMLKTKRLLKRFSKEHPAVYAAYLMDK